MQVEFRQAERADVGAIIALLADDPIGKTRENASLVLDHRYADAFAEIERDGNQLLAVAENGGEIIGCLQLTFIPGLTRTGMWRGQVEGVRIAKAHRGSAIGKQFFEWALERCRERQCELVQLTTDKARGEAVEFYEKLGFVASHEGMKLVIKPKGKT